MAKEISTKFAIDLSSIVTNSVTAAKSVRRGEQAKKEAEFQRQIAAGLPYSEQVKIREKQLEDEMASPFSDPDYVASLQKSVTDTKKLDRFNKYRTRYSTTLGDLSAGKINEEEYLETLQSELVGVTDPDLRLEIQNDIASARAKVKEYRDTILSNQVRKAKYDGTQDVLNQAIIDVQTARSNAVINENEDEVGAYDETLSALRSQLSGVRIQDSITNYQATDATRGYDPRSKLQFLSDQIDAADALTPVKIGDQNFASAQAYWQGQRDTYLAGTNQMFGDFFNELNNDIKNSLSTTTAQFGYPPQFALDDVQNVYNGLKERPEMAPFVNKLNASQTAVMTESADMLAKKIVEAGTENLTFREADANLVNLQSRYGLNVDAYRSQLDRNLIEATNNKFVSLEEAEALATDLEIKMPEVAAPATPSTTPGSTPATSMVRTIKSGDTLTKIAQESGISLQQLLEANPQFRSNPDMIRPGQTVNLPGTPVAPTTTEQPAPALPSPAPSMAPATVTPPAAKTQPAPATPTPAAPAQPNIPSNATPPTAAPQPTATPATPPPAQPPAPTATKPAASSYTGSSVVDYLKSVGKDASVQSRAKLALEQGVVKTEDEYIQAANTGKNAQMNTKLLESLRKQT